MGVDLAWIRSFLALAQTRNFAKAAARTNVTQPAFSRRIRALETWVGADLIDRSTYPTTLTPAGERFLSVADDIDQKLGEVRAEIAEAAPATRPEIVIAAQHTLALSFLPSYLRALRSTLTDAQVVVHAENIHDSSDRLVAGNADILLAFAPTNTPTRLAGSDINARRVGRDRLVPVSVPDRNGGPAWRLDDAPRQPIPRLAYGQGTLLEPLVRELVEHGRLPTEPVVRNPITEVLRRFALSGLGVGWLPETLVADDLATGRLVLAGDARWAVDLPVYAYRLAQRARPLLADVWANLPDDPG
jgi:DNA-binding transcriptional LysR family regulator